MSGVIEKRRPRKLSLYFLPRQDRSNSLGELDIAFLFKALFLGPKNINKKARIRFFIEESL
jgi:hypothetical protein